MEIIHKIRAGVSLAPDSRNIGKLAQRIAREAQFRKPGTNADVNDPPSAVIQDIG